ncbi:MAG: hypothetical protein JOZ19_07680 [Rubrobacter sp.]|nr:hypothetical protein [Rubrobacter sp.]
MDLVVENYDAADAAGHLAGRVSNGRSFVQRAEMLVRSDIPCEGEKGCWTV